MKYFNFLLLVSFLMIVSCQQDNSLKIDPVRVNLDEGWQFRQVGESRWMPATVPGTVHTDLLANAVIEDPFYRTNEKELQWIDKAGWEYKTVFNVNDKLMDKNELRLIFEGLDTYAAVFLNGTELLRTDNMFRTWNISCKEFLLEGENEIRVKLDSPAKRGLELLHAHGYPLPASNDQSENGEMGNNKVSVFTRKAGYHYGWDWGPRLLTSGIWRPVSLLAYDYGEVDNVHFIQKKITKQQAMLKAVVNFTSLDHEQLDFSVYVNGTELVSKIQQLEKGENTIVLDFEIDKPELWWPNGMGKQHLYDVEIAVRKGDNRLVSITNEKIGLRTIELVQQADEEGKTFFFKVNGLPVFAKGANYIPNDVFLPRVQPEDYARIIKDATDANMNMLRVWGGGIYENDIFYDLCDQYGILVWQDFMYACSMYPGDDEFLKNARIEAEENIIRLRNHPSLALWCGNNEIEIAWAEYEEGRGWGWKERYTKEQKQQIWHDYDTLFHHILPAVVEKYSPEISYWHSSPSAGMGKLASHTNTSGDMHYWGVWHGKEPLKDFRKYRARFMSEYGFQSFPEMNTVKTYTLRDDWDIESEVMAAHQRSGIGNLRIRQYMEEDYIIPDDFEQFLYVSQLLQAEAIKMAIETHRSEMPYCMGTLYWQLNDCWPVASWSGIDYYGRWKAMHYFVKEAFKETIVVSRQTRNDIEILAINDKREDKPIQLNLEIRDFNGKKLWEKSYGLSLPAFAATKIASLTMKQVHQLGNTNRMVLISKLFRDNQLIDTDLHYFEKVKNLDLPASNLKIETRTKEGLMEVMLKSKNLTKNVFISTDLSTANFSGNFFDLLPGETRYITFPGEYKVDEFNNSLKILYLNPEK